MSPDRPTPADRRWEPLYDALRGDITAGRRAVGSQIPSMHTLSAEHGVSVRSARTALERLEAEGLVTMQAGVGTFVAKQEPSTMQEQVARLERELRRTRRDVDKLLAAIFPPDMAAEPDL
jgi:DNA-binding GntR family transcriptional regulator